MVRAIALLIACVFATGCFVFDELDKGKKFLDQHSPKKPAAAAAAEKPGPQKKTGAGWWANAKSLSGPAEDDGKNPVIACAVGKATSFMHKNDCLSQGGHPSS
jgi:hypothetical protein